MVCLDTDVIIDFLRNDESMVKKVRQLIERQVPLTTTVINSLELIKGALRSKNTRKLQSTYDFLHHVKILNFDFSCSKKCAELSETLRSNGLMVDHLDLMIATIAIINNETLFTRNLRHFERVPELILEKS